MGDQNGTDDIQNNTDETSWKKGDKRCFISCQIVKKFEMRVGSVSSGVRMQCKAISCLAPLTNMF